MNQLDHAIKCYEKALKLNPQYIEVLFNLFFIFNELSDIKSASKVLKKINNIDHKNYSIIAKIISLGKFDNEVDYKKLFDRFCKLLNEKEKKFNFSNYLEFKSTIALIGFGRSGSMFLHSLFDGHPEISTLPGYFFKGWFNNISWSLFEPNYSESNWREKLTKKIIDIYEPQFNASSKKNVIGKPNGENEWLAKSLGFTKLGDDGKDTLKLDQEEFKKYLIKFLRPLDKIDSKICFQLIHKAFDEAYRTEVELNKKNKILFYHIHNPDEFEYANFLRNFPEAKILYLIRNPLQMIESWVAFDLKKLESSVDHNIAIQLYDRILGKIYYPFEFFNNPFNTIHKNQIRGIKLEDIKRNPNEIIPIISNWIGIEDHFSLYKSEFMNEKYSRPSQSFDGISGFDLNAIDVKIGRFFGQNDIKILETLMWPFLNNYNYTKISLGDFKKNLLEIDFLLNKPMEFEYKLNKLIFDQKTYKRDSNEKFRSRLLETYKVLSEKLTFPHMVKPLIKS